MQQNHHHNEAFNAADIERYFRGKMSDVEMYRMEKAALDDPFLADAMEGYTTTYLSGSHTSDEDLNELQHRLRKRLQKNDKKTAVLRWWKPAAAAIFIIVAGSLGYYLLILPSPPKMAQTESVQKEVAKSTPGSSGKTSLNLSSADSAKLNPDQPPTAISDQSVVAEGSRIVPAAPATVKPKAEIARKKKQPFSKPIQEQPNAVATEITALSKDAEVDSEAGLPAGKPAADIIITGIVTDQKLKPVKGAFVTLQGKISGVVTDSQGRFNLPSNESLNNISIASVGFEKKEVLVAPSDLGNEVKIRLNPAENAMNEVVVSGYSNRSKKTQKISAPVSDNNVKELSVNIQNAVPVNGWDEYNSYLQKNKNIPDSLHLMHGNVVIGFDVNSKGKLSDFSVHQSLHPVLDAEAIRLIKQGPSWKILKGRRTGVTVIIPF